MTWHLKAHSKTATVVSMSSAASRGWGPGWPNCQRGTIVTLVRPDGLRLPIRREIAPLVAWLMDETERRGYDIRPDWTWGYACRAIRGSSSPSNHSWGLAVDINAPKNPMGSRLITDMPRWMTDLWKAHGFGWGGDYRSRPDAMHMEFLGTPADAARYIAQVQKPKPPVVLPFIGFKLGATDDTIEKAGGRNNQVSELQLLLLMLKYTNAPLSGIYTKQWVEAWIKFQKDQHALTPKDSRWINPSSAVNDHKMNALRWWAANKKK